MAARAAAPSASQQDGAAAVEFALVAAPFLALVFAIMETAIVFFAGQALETAVADSSRLIMTGQAQTPGLRRRPRSRTRCAPRSTACSIAQNGVYVDVKKFTSFAASPCRNPVDANGNFQNNFTYQPGGPGDIVVVRLFYQWPVYVSLLGFNLPNMTGGKRLLVATAAFRNEPYAMSGVR